MGLQSHNFAQRLEGNMFTRDLRVLLVEDSRLLSERILEIINDLDGVTSVGAVTTEAEAIQELRTQAIDAILLDLRLKEGTGFGVLRYLKSTSSKSAVVVISNYAVPQYRREAEALGARYFLDKMQEFDRIPAVLEALRSELTS